MSEILPTPEEQAALDRASKRKANREAIIQLDALAAVQEADPALPVPDFATLIKALPQGRVDALRKRLEQFDAAVLHVINAAQLTVDAGGDPGALDWDGIVAKLGA